MSGSDNEADQEMKALLVAAEEAGQRLDQWLAAKLAPELSRSRLQMLIKQGAVSTSDTTVTEPKRKVIADELYELKLPEPEAPEPMPEDIPLNILHEDEALIVIDKPAGLVVHPGPGNWTGTLVNALIHHCGDTLSGIGGVRRPGIVHRLDRETSGVMVVAKTDTAHRALAEAFADHGRQGDLERAYVALVWGKLPRKVGTIKTYLGRSSSDRTLRAVVSQHQPDAREAITHYRVLDTFGLDSSGEALASLVECRLETGRTHQIRVHMAHLGHPLIGDPAYGRAFRTKANRLEEPVANAVNAFSRQALHARLLAFRHPLSEEVMRFEAPIPPDMAELMRQFASL